MHVSHVHVCVKGNIETRERKKKSREKYRKGAFPVYTW